MSVLGSISGAIKGIGGFLLNTHMVNALVKFLTYIPQVVLFVDKVGDIVLQLTGKKVPSADKKTLAMELVREAILTSELVSGKEIIDEDLFTESLSKIVDGVVGIKNATK